MKAITVRNLPPPLQAVVRARAEREGISLNKAIALILAEAAGVKSEGKKKRRHNDLDRWAGTWTKKDADDFNRALAEQRAIDPEMWK